MSLNWSVRARNKTLTCISSVWFCELRDEETGVAAARRAFNDVTVEKQIAKEDSDDEDDEGGYSDNEYAEEEFEVTSS